MRHMWKGDWKEKMSDWKERLSIIHEFIDYIHIFSLGSLKSLYYIFALPISIHIESLLLIFN